VSSETNGLDLVTIATAVAQCHNATCIFVMHEQTVFALMSTSDVLASRLESQSQFGVVGAASSWLYGLISMAVSNSFVLADIRLI